MGDGNGFGCSDVEFEFEVTDDIKDARVYAVCCCVRLWWLLLLLLLLLAARLGVDLRGESSWLMREEAACATLPPKNPDALGEGASVIAVEGREFALPYFAAEPGLIMPRPFIVPGPADSGLADDVVVVVMVGAVLLMDAARSRDSSSS